MSVLIGKITNVYEELAGSELAVATAAVDTVITVVDATPFNEDGGSLTISGGSVRSYTTCDYDLNTVTLSAAVGSIIAVGEEVNVSPSGTVRWAMIQPDDLDEGVRALVPQSMKDRVATGIREETDQESALVISDHGRWVIQNIDQEVVIITGTIIQTAENTGPGQQGMRIMADTAGGVLQFWTGVDPSEAAGYLDPYAASGGNPSFRIAGGTINVAGRVFPTPAQIDFIAGNGRGTVVFGGMTDAGAGVTGYTCDVSVSGTISSSGDISAGQAILNSGSVLMGADILIEQNPPTTTAAANMNWNSTNGRLRLVTSLLKHKLFRRFIKESDAEPILNLQPRTWYDSGEVEENDGKIDGLRRYSGLIAEEVEELIPELATYDVNGDLVGVAYDRVAPYLIPIIRGDRKRISALEAKVSALIALVETL